MKRKLKYDPSPLAQSRARERMMRIITDQEEAYLANLVSTYMCVCVSVYDEDLHRPRGSFSH